MIRFMTDLIVCWNTDACDRNVALTKLMIMPSLLLQKSAEKASAQVCKEHLLRRLDLWENDKIDDLMQEGRAIQERLKKAKSKYADDSYVTKTFSFYMMNGRVKAAINLLAKAGKGGGVLPINTETLKLLHEKHPDASELNDDQMLEGPINFVHPVIFDEITPELVKRSAANTTGACGPSGLDADDWRRIIGSNIYGQTGSDLRKAIADFTKKLCHKRLKDDELKSVGPIQACRLIPLDKCPGLRPIGIGEVLRRIMGKCVMSVLSKDVIEAAGNLQLCAGQKSGCEVAVHAMTDFFRDDDGCEGVLQIDATNAFNSLNRAVMLHNIKIICPQIAVYVENCYGKPARLFVLGGAEILSSEGTTQGDPIAMAIYALGILPLMWTVRNACLEVNGQGTLIHVAYADDLTGCGSLILLRLWFDQLIAHGKSIGYYVNAGKTWLIVPEKHLAAAQRIFADVKIKITTEGKRHLGATVGSETYKATYVEEKVADWINELRVLCRIARCDPHSALAAFTHGLRSRYTYLMRTVPGISDFMSPLEEVIRNEFLPILMEGHKCNDPERLLLSLPPKLGGMGIINPQRACSYEYANSRKVTEHAVNLVKQQCEQISEEQAERAKDATREIKKEKSNRQQEDLQKVKEKIADESQLRSLELSMEPGAYNWLTALPIEDQGFHLDKRSFWDAIRVRYNLPLSRLPERCACGNSFTIQHALSCHKGGFIQRRHNEVRDITAALLSEACKDVETEPSLEPLTGELLKASANTQDEARVDIAARDFWCYGQRAYFDVRIFNPHARCYSKYPLQKCYSNEMEKKRTYNQRILQTENGSFTPLVFSATGGMSRECHNSYRKLAMLLSQKKNSDLSKTTTLSDKT